MLETQDHQCMKTYYEIGGDAIDFDHYTPDLSRQRCLLCCVLRISLILSNVQPTIRIDLPGRRSHSI